MNPGQSQNSILSQIVGDRVIQVYLGLCIFSSIPYFLTNLTEYQLATIEWVLNTFLLLPFIAVVLWPTRKTPLTPAERGFWKTLSIAFVFWTVVSLLSLLWQIDAISGPMEIPIEFLYLGYYVSWLLALSFAPHHQQAAEYASRNRGLLWASILILSVSLFLYFILIPSQFASESYETWVPSMIFYSFMDTIMVVILYVAAKHASSYRWRTLYTMLLMSAVLFLIFDLLETVSFNENFSFISNSTLITVLWNLPLIGVVISGRARNFKMKPTDFPEPHTDKPARRPDSLTSPIIMVAFVLPVLHTVAYQLGLIEEEAEVLQSAVVLISLVVFWGLAVAENRWLRKLNRQARVHAEENEKLRIKNKVAEESERVKAQFLANVSHEIRTPMNGILGMSEIMLKEDMSSEHRKQAQLIQSSAEGLLAIIDDILHYSRLGYDEVVFIEKPFNLKETARQVLDMFHVTWRAKGVEIQTRYSSDLPDLVVGDASRYRQVLVNLIGNALKFTPSGSVSLELSCTRIEPSELLLMTRVRDTGIGISEKNLEKVFEPFSQVDESNSRSFGGSGLGLAISKQIVEAQGGKIGVESNSGEGSVFWFELAFNTVEEKQTESRKENEPSVFSPEAGKILLAEDNEINQLVALKQIETLGLNADVVNDGEEAVQAVKSGNYSLVLMDCQMPRLDGIEATRQLREQGYGAKDLPILALTAHVFDEDRKRCLEAGMNDFLSKPISVDDLRTALARWLSSNTDSLK